MRRPGAGDAYCRAPSEKTPFIRRSFKPKLFTRGFPVSASQLLRKQLMWQLLLSTARGLRPALTRRSVTRAVALMTDPWPPASCADHAQGPAGRGAAPSAGGPRAPEGFFRRLFGRSAPRERREKVH